MHTDRDTMFKDFFWQEGLREKTFFDQVRQIQDPITGMFVSRPVPLDGAGKALPAGQALVEKDCQYYFLRDWSLLAGVP